MLDSESESENENESENEQVNKDPLIKLIESRDIEKIRKTVTPSGLEKSAEKFKENLLEYSLKVSHKLKQSADGSHRKDLDNLGSSVEEYARRLLKYSVYKQWSQERDFIDCIDRITYAAIHFRCKKMVAAILAFSLILTKIYVSDISYVGRKTSHGFS
ncbi:hypothetical protein AC249_AIPGENE3741 [Exaiptasia diaphana]|nr:hypothetical protein AC249_AIPGENE3741 [Exaiptasia diaphana]